MVAARTLPISAENREFTVKVSGTAVARELPLVSVSVVKCIDRISSARLVYADGAAAASDFPLSNATTFEPGNELEIIAGSGSGPVSLFKGIVVAQSIRVRGHGSSQLVVECRHAATKLTVGRKNAYFLDQTDDEIIRALLRGAKLDAEVESTSIQHAQQVQFRATDWDFLLARAHANGKFVFTNADKVVVKTPASSGSSVCSLQFGATILEFDAEIDARTQWAAVRGVSWDPSRQELVEAQADDPGLNSPGNLSTSRLASVAGLSSYELRHSALVEGEARAWAESEWLRSQLSRVSGRVKCEGIGTINPGDFVTLEGVGQRFQGDVFVTGVRHDFDLAQHWKTHVQFGSAPSLKGDESHISAPPAAALLPAVSGLQIAKVVSNEDPDGEFRVQVRLPLVDNEQGGVWARVASLDAGPERGFFFRPEVGDEVVVGFLEDDPRRPLILGMLYSSAHAAPLSGTSKNHEKVYQSRSKLKLYFNDEKKLVRLETPAGNLLTLDEAEKTVSLADQNGNKLQMTEDGIQIESSKAITLKAGTELKLESGTGLSVKAGTELELQGSAGAELSSTATTKVKGTLVQLN